MEWLWIIGAIVWGAIWGFVAYSIVLNRGYPKEEANKWEFVGFFLGIIGVISIVKLNLIFIITLWLR